MDALPGDSGIAAIGFGAAIAVAACFVKLTFIGLQIVGWAKGRPSWLASLGIGYICVIFSMCFAALIAGLS